MVGHDAMEVALAGLDMRRFFFVTFVLATINCSTLVTLNHNIAYCSDGRPIIYSGTRENIAVINTPTGEWNFFPIGRCIRDLAVIDFPFSFLADTIFLPVTIPMSLLKDPCTKLSDLKNSSWIGKGLKKNQPESIKLEIYHDYKFGMTLSKCEEFDNILLRGKVHPKSNSSGNFNCFSLFFEEAYQSITACSSHGSNKLKFVRDQNDTINQLPNCIYSVTGFELKRDAKITSD